MDCGLVSEHSIPDYQHSYQTYQDTTYHTTFSYKRSNRFKEILSTIQAKEHIDIPNNVLNAIEDEINKENNLNRIDIDVAKIRFYLKKLSLTQYYDHIPNILKKINGIKAITIPIEIEDKFLEMFQTIQEPFETVRKQVCPLRQSFLSYHFVFYKFCELLDLHEYKHCFTLLKSNEKLKIQDEIWKGICKILNWEYIRST
jgi:hypothetical protein